MTDHANIVREGAAFYMTHQYRPVPGEPTERHNPEGCKGCAAEAALDALVAERDKFALNNSVLFDHWKAAEAERDDAREALRGAMPSSTTTLLDRLGAAEAERDRLREAAAAYLQRQQEMKGAVLTGGDFLLLAQAEDNLRAALAPKEAGNE